LVQPDPSHSDNDSSVLLLDDELEPENVTATDPPVIGIVMLPFTENPKSLQLLEIRGSSPTPVIWPVSSLTNDVIQ